MLLLRSEISLTTHDSEALECQRRRDAPAGPHVLFPAIYIFFDRRAGQ